MIARRFGPGTGPRGEAPRLVEGDHVRCATGFRRVSTAAGGRGLLGEDFDASPMFG